MRRATDLGSVLTVINLSRRVYFLPSEGSSDSALWVGPDHSLVSLSASFTVLWPAPKAWGGPEALWIPGLLRTLWAPGGKASKSTGHKDSYCHGFRKQLAGRDEDGPGRTCWWRWRRWKVESVVVWRERREQRRRHGRITEQSHQAVG